MALNWLVFVMGPLYLIGTWFRTSVTIKEQTPYKHMFNRNRTISLSINNHSTFNIEHKWVDLCIQLSNQQTTTFDNCN